MIPHPAPLAAAALALVLLIAPASAQTTSNPIPGIDIIVKKNPGPRVVVAATSGRDGRFSARVRLEPGFEYEVSTACRARTACPAHELVSLTVEGRPARRIDDPSMQTRSGRNGIGIYIIGPVILGMREPPPVVISGQVTAPRVAETVDPRGSTVIPRTTPGPSAATRN